MHQAYHRRHHGDNRIPSGIATQNAVCLHHHSTQFGHGRNACLPRPRRRDPRGCDTQLLRWPPSRWCYGNVDARQQAGGSTPETDIGFWFFGPVGDPSGRRAILGRWFVESNAHHCHQRCTTGAWAPAAGETTLAPTIPHISLVWGQCSS